MRAVILHARRTLHGAMDTWCIYKADENAYRLVNLLDELLLSKRERDCMSLLPELKMGFKRAGTALVFKMVHRK